jgi:UDP-2,4-diacetamido-2,4,6-trideoxy-beta-L-altropyranose hydrolase
MAKKIIFRADGSQKTGLGHLYRLFSLVEICKEKYCSIFITRSNSFINVIPKEYICDIIPEDILIDEEPQWLASKYPSSDYIIIADGYDFNSAYQKKVKNLGYKLIYIDDLKKGKQYADIIVNHSPGVTSEDYDAQDYTKFALGPDYALIRPAFVHKAQERKSISVINNILISFGGADTNNFTLRFLKILLGFNFKRISVVMGGAYPYEDSIKEIGKSFPEVKFYKSLTEEEMCKQMANADLAIVPASSVLFEVIAAGALPVISYYVENQKLFHDYLFKKGIFSFGNILDTNETQWREILQKVIELPPQNVFLQTFRSKLINTRDNHLNQIKNLL